MSFAHRHAAFASRSTSHSNVYSHLRFQLKFGGILNHSSKMTRLVPNTDLIIFMTCDWPDKAIDFGVLTY